MKIKKLHLLLTSFLILTGLIYLYDFNSTDENIGQSDLKDEMNRYEEKLYPYEGLQIAKNYPNKSAGVAAKEAAIREAIYMSKGGVRTGGNWQVQGPGNIGARINTIAISPFDEKVIFVGFSTGGVWRTVDGGSNWEPVFDDQTFSSIGDIVFHPDEPNTLFVGTGDPNIGGYFFIGDGIYKSEDLGENWEYKGLKETRVISSIAIDPQNTNIMYAASMGPPYERNEHRGVFKSVDGGENWSSTLYIDNQTGVTDILIHPNRPNILYASAWTRVRNHKESSLNSDKAGVYRSEDGGQSWEKLENGLPNYSTSRVGIVQSKEDPNVLYALVVSANNQNPEGLYKTEDGGDTWVKWNLNQNEFLSSLGGFGWYFGKIEIDPFDINKVYVLGVNLWSIQKSDTFKIELAAPNWPSYEVHADKHDMVFHKNKVYLATDGGLYKSDVVEGAPFIWKDAENIPTTQFYRVAFNPHNPNFYIGGAQDNGTTGGNINNINAWERIRGGDGFQPAFYKNNDQIWFAETQRGNIYYSENAGFNWSNADDGLNSNRHWDMQYIISPHDDNVLYTATDQVYTASNGLPEYWYPISDTIVDFDRDAFIHQATSIDQSELNKNILYVGTSDGLVWRTLDEGQSWEHLINNLPDRYVSSIKASPNVEGNAYVTFSGYRDGDFTPKIFKTTDFGTNWLPINGNLPNLAINDVFIYPYRNDDAILFAATDAGVYVTKDNGTTWDRMGENMINIPVYDLAYNDVYNQMIAATYGRSIMTFNLDQISIKQDVSHVFDEKRLQFKVYPNPTSDDLTIELFTNYEELIMVDIDGKIVMKRQLRKGTNTVHMAEFHAGIYYAKVGKKVEKISLIK